MNVVAARLGLPLFSDTPGQWSVQRHLMTVRVIAAALNLPGAGRRLTESVHGSKALFDRVSETGNW